MRVLGPDHPQTLTSRNNLAAAQAVAGIPSDARLLVDYWLATETWNQSFAVLDAAEARLRGAPSTAKLAQRTESGDPAAGLHQRILAAAQHLDRPSLYAIVTNLNRALATAMQHADAGRYQDAQATLALNPTAAGHPAGIAAALITQIAAGNDDAATGGIAQLHQADSAGAVLDATTQLQDHLTTDTTRTAAATLKARLENT